MRKQMKPWMQKLATIHAMNEAATKNMDAKAILESWGNMHMNPDANYAGMGDPTLPTGSMNPDGTFTGANGGSYGSGDMPSSTLPMAMAIAAQTIALELLPTVPISTALTILPYVNGVYAGGATNRFLGGLDTSNKNARILKADLAVVDDDKAAVLAALKGKQQPITDGDAASTGATVTFTGMLSFYDNQPIFEIVYPLEAYRNGNAATAAAQIATGVNLSGVDYEIKIEYTIKDGVATIGTLTLGAATTTDPESTTAYARTFQTVKSYEDFVPFFTGVSKYGVNGKPTQGSYDEEGKFTSKYDYDLNNLNPYLRSEGEVTPANKMSLEMASTKVDAKTLKVAGEITREQFQDMTAYGYDPYGFLNAVLINECTQRINFDVLQNLHKLGAKHAAAVGFDATIFVGGDLHENTLTIQKQVVAKINLASNIISVRSRVSPADWVVLGAGMGTALQDMPTFLASPATTFAQATGNNAIYQIGSLGRLKIYVDPYMPFDSTDVLVGAIGTEQSPGLKFMPYILADSLTYPSEGMGGQNMVSMISRYALAGAGMHPESLYLGFKFKLKKADTATTLSEIFPYLG